MLVLPRHDTMNMTLGEPALIHLGDKFPSFVLHSEEACGIEGEIFHDGIKIVEIPFQVVKQGNETIDIDGMPKNVGEYHLQLKIKTSDNSVFYETLFFTVLKKTTENPEDCRSVRRDSTGKMICMPDYRGNRVPDFSNCGYGGGGISLPEAPVKEVVEPGEAGDEEQIQSAIDRVAALQPDNSGIRGAVLLRKGIYRIKHSLRINASGVVLRGEGQGENGTTLYALGDEKRALIQVEGRGGPVEVPGTGVRITDLYVPVGARSFHIDQPERLRIGDSIMIVRYGNREWIHEISMDRITPRNPEHPEWTRQWDPFALEFDRVITGIQDNRITVDAPITCAVDWQWGGGEVYKYEDRERIQQVGIEHIRAVSDFNTDVVERENGQEYYADEDHADRFIYLNHAKNAWIRNCTALHFSFALVETGRASKWVTIQDCQCLNMTSRIDGGRRYSYYYTGQLALTQRVYAETARHAFVVGSFVPGPNVFYQCESSVDYNTSEPHHRWSVGGLYDNVKSLIAIQDRQYYGSGHGWAGANYVAWNTEGDLILQKPPTAQNWSFGHVGRKQKGAFEPREQGHWESHGIHMDVKSLYIQQLQDRLGKAAVENII